MNTHKISSLLLLICLSLGACQKQMKESPKDEGLIEKTEAKNTTQAPATSSPRPMEMEAIRIPEGFSLLGEASGDLDKDGEAEKIQVYDTDEEAEMGTARALYIYKAKGTVWEIWHKSRGAVLSSTHGGMMGDPFEEIRIERGAIVIDHFGGSRVKWNYTHRYRFQNNDWYLIGASIRDGAPCDYWDHFDYNLSTGKIDIKKEVENCDDESQKKETAFHFLINFLLCPKWMVFIQEIMK